MTVVLDASAALAGLAKGSRHSEWVSNLIAEEEILAPDVALIELVQIVREATLRGNLDEHLAAEMVSSFSQLVDDFYPHRPLIGHVWEHRHVLSAYDGTYVAHAALLRLPLVTLDDRLARGAYRICEILRPPESKGQGFSGLLRLLSRSGLIANLHSPVSGPAYREGHEHTLRRRSG